MPQLVRSGIVDAYVQGLQMRRQQEQQEFQNQQKQEENKRAQEQLQGYLKHLDAETEHQKAQLALQQQHLDLNKKDNIFKAVQFLSEQQNKGLYDPNGRLPDATSIGGQIQTTQTPGSPGPTYDIGNLPTTQQNIQPTLSTMPTPQPAQVEIASGVMFNPAGVKNNDEIFRQHLAQLQEQAPVEANIAGQKAGAVAKATAEVTQPFEMAKIGAKSEADLKLQEERKALALAVAEKNATSRKYAADIAAQSRINAAKLSKEIDPELIGVNSILHATGQGGTPLTNAKNDVATKLNMNKQGLVDFSPKDATALKQVHSMDPIFAKIEQIIAQLPETPTGALGQRVMAAIPGTELNNLKAELISASGNIAKTRGGESRALTDKDIGRQINALGGPGKTKEQALSNLRFLRAYAASAVTDQILGGQSDKQKILNLHTYDFDPAIYGGFVDYKGVPHQKYSQNPNNPDEWGVFNTKTGLYDKIGK